MSKARVVTDFTRYSDSDLETQGRIIIEACKSNNNFSFSEGLLEDASDMLGEYTLRLSEAATGDKVSIKAKGQSKVLLQDFLRRIAMEANAEARGDELLLLSTKIPLIATNHVANIVGVATGLRARNNDVFGEIELSVDVSSVRDHGTVFCYTEEDEITEDKNDWRQISVNSHRGTIGKLKSGLIYSFAAAYRGADKMPLLWCPAISVRVL